MMRARTRCIGGAVIALLGAVGATFWWNWVGAPRPSDLATLLREARSAALRHDTSALVRSCESILTVAPDHTDTIMLVARHFIRSNEPAVAIEWLRRIQRGPTEAIAEARYQEAGIQLSLGRAKDAEEPLRRALALTPGWPPAEKLLRDMYTIQVRRDDLRALLRSRRKVRPWSLTDLLDFMVAGQVPRNTLGNWMERIQFFVAGDPSDNVSRLALATYYLIWGKDAECAAIAGEILREQPSWPRARALLAEAIRNQGKLEDARRTLEAAPADSAADSAADSWLSRVRGTLAMEDGRLAEAVAQFEMALRLDPGETVALHQLGMAKGRLGDINEGHRLMRSAQQMATLVDTANRLMKESAAGEEPKDVLPQLLDLTRSLVDAGRNEDAFYCCEFLKQHGHEDSELRRLQSLAAKALATAAETLKKEAPRIATSSGLAPSTVRSVPPPGQSVKQPRPKLAFDDIAASVGLSFEYFPGRTGNKFLFEQMGGGSAAFDYDNDGWPDLYFAQGSRYPREASDLTFTDALFRNVGGQTALNVTASARLGDPDYSLGCAAGDFDNDGLTDVFVSNYGPNRVYRNQGDGTFEDVTSSAGLAAPGMNMSMALADLDRDGDLDLYIVRYVTSIKVCRDSKGLVWVCVPTEFEGEVDALFENQGDGRFTDVSQSSGVCVPDGKGLGVVVAHLDDDELPDIYVANDTTPNFLFHNRSAPVGDSAGSRLKFEECGLLAGVAVDRNGRAEAGMGIACADFDGNGRLDLYVTNFHLETNTLYLNQRPMQFEDSIEPAALVADTNPLLGFGTIAIDADLDNHEDVFVANGHIDDYRSRDPEVQWKMPARLYQNFGALRFEDVSSAAGAFFSQFYLGRGAMRLDWNRDGLEDVLVVHQDEPAALLQNGTATPFHRVTVDLIGSRSARDAVNARIWATFDNHRILREVIGGGGYLSEHERRQIIGLGAHSGPMVLEIEWPSGRRQTVTLLSDASATIVESRSPEFPHVP